MCPVCNAKITKDGFVPIYGNGSDYGNGNGNNCAHGNTNGNGYENAIPNGNGSGYNNGYMNTNGNGNTYGYGGGDGNGGYVNGNGSVNSYENQNAYRNNTSGNGNVYECENTYYPNYSWGDGYGIRSANENRNGNGSNNGNERRNENGFGDNNVCTNGNRHENGNEAGCSNRYNNENVNECICINADIHGDSNNNICRNENESRNVYTNNGNGDRYTRQEKSNCNIPPRPRGQRYPTSSNQTSERDYTSSNTNTTNNSCEGIPVVFTYGLYGYDQSKQNQSGNIHTKSQTQIWTISYLLIRLYWLSNVWNGYFSILLSTNWILGSSME